MRTPPPSTIATWRTDDECSRIPVEYHNHLDRYGSRVSARDGRTDVCRPGVDTRSTRRQPGTLGLPVFAQIAVGAVLLDFSTGYVAHRLLHMWPAMWRFHRIHHSDEFVDVTTTYRTHPVESVWRFLFAIAPVWAVGIPAQAVVIQRLLQATNGVLEHANIRLWSPIDRVLSLVWVTPNVHKIHHSRELSETNSNYGNVLSLYDRLLGTFTPVERASSLSYGLNDVDPARAASFPALLAMPFRDSELVREPAHPAALRERR